MNAPHPIATEGPTLRTADPNCRVALRGVQLKAQLTGLSCRAMVAQTWINLEPNPIEAVYTFPLSESAAVCHFEVLTSDRVLTGKVDAREKAIETYNDAVDDGHAAFLLEQERPDVFTVRVGNINPGQAASVRLSYVMPLETVDRAVRLAFPTTVAPRYVPQGGDPLQNALDHDAVNAPQAMHVPYGLSMELDVDLGRPLSVRSPSHAIQVESTGVNRHRVSFAGGVSEMNRDVVLELKLKADAEPVAQAQVGPDGAHYVAVSFVPDFGELLGPRGAEYTAPRRRETVFVVDCSGSMEGNSIAQARTALALCLRSMSAGERFNILRFGSTFEQMSTEPLVYADDTLARALAYAEGTDANLGGTEMFAPLALTLNTPLPAGVLVRQVIVLTDGQVSNEDVILKLAKQNAKHNRVFSFGIGSAPSRHLITSLAKLTGGAAEFIADGERIDTKVLRTFARLAGTPATDVAIEWDDKDVAQTPGELTSVFDGDALVAFARVGGKSAPRSATLRCTVAGHQHRWRVAIPPASQGYVVPTLWARGRIADLEQSVQPGESAERIVAISKEFNVLSALTAFVTVEHRTEDDRNDGRPELRRVPTQLARGWGGGPGDTGVHFAMRLAPAPMPAQAAPVAGGRARGGPKLPSPGGIVSKLFGRKQKKSGAVGASYADMAAPPPPSAPPAASTLDRTIDATVLAEWSNRAAGGGPQEEVAAGAADPDEPLFDLLAAQDAKGRIDAAELVRALLGVDATLAPAPAARPTLLALVALRVRFPDRRSLWRRADDKARGWLAGELGKSEPELATLLDEIAAT
jgi:Ca-activated chloride channel family protein